MKERRGKKKEFLRAKEIRNEKPNEIRLKGKGRKWKRIFLPSFLSSRRDEGGGVEEGGNGRRWKREKEKGKNFLEQRK